MSYNPDAPRGRWANAGDLVAAFTRRAQAPTDRLAILNSVWDKECGAYAKHWALIGVKKGILYVRPKSSAAAQELHMRSENLVKGLNKYFSRPWIIAVRTTYR
jgi:predicted nucleic acid-binding Zn ribbon protein